MVGDAPAIGTNGLGRHVVMIVGSNGTFCTGTALARDLVLTAVHCLPRRADYKLVEFGGAEPRLKHISAVERHPAFTARGMTTHRGTADVALVKLAEPLPASIRPAPLGRSDEPVKVGDAFTAVGFGITRPGDPRSGGTIRSAKLVATGKPDRMDVRLTDPATHNTRAGRGACTGDSGGPVFAESAGQFALVGVISWTTGAKYTSGCGGITGMTPLARYRGWIVETARKLGSPLAP
ncbi:MAG: trypsin-like serine protease [Rhizobiales bacterium]|nr:trypsin-like serine protease [Hyphomicrobiales bacterium]